MTTCLPFFTDYCIIPCFNHPKDHLTLQWFRVNEPAGIAGFFCPQNDASFEGEIGSLGQYNLQQKTLCCKTFGKQTTLPETNMAPENRPPNRKGSYSNHPFLGAMLVSGRVTTRNNNFATHGSIRGISRTQQLQPLDTLFGPRFWSPT